MFSICDSMEFGIISTSKAGNNCTRRSLVQFTALRVLLIQNTTANHARSLINTIALLFVFNSHHNIVETKGLKLKLPKGHANLLYANTLPS